MDWLQIFVQLILTGILLYVFQRVIDERAERRLEEFKSELKTTAFEKETKFSKLHEKRVEVISEINKEVSKVYYSLIGLITILQSSSSFLNEEIKRESNNSYNSMFAFMHYFEENKLYLPKNLCQMIEALHIQFLHAHLNLISTYGNGDTFKMENNKNIDYQDSVRKISSFLFDEVEPLKNEIELELRNLIGS